MPWNPRQAGTPRSLGTVLLRAHVVPAGGWVCWPVLPACQLALSTCWLAPQPLGWATDLPTTGVRSRWAGRSIGCPQKLPAGSATLGAWVLPGWCRELVCWLWGMGSWHGSRDNSSSAPPRCPVKCPRVWTVGTKARFQQAWIGRRGNLLFSEICLDCYKRRIPGDNSHPSHRI